MFGLILLPFLGWVFGTALGAYASKVITDDKLLSALGIALYAMFIAIIIPDARRSIKITFVILVSISISCFLYYVPYVNTIGLGFKIIISTVISSLLATFLFPISDDIEDIDEKAKEDIENE